MKAIVVGENQSLEWSDAETPRPGADEVLIRVHATAINRADLLQRRGGYPSPPGASSILGLECAGEIAEVGEGVSRFTVGDRVCALLAGGGYAEYAVAHAGSVLPIPGGHSFAHGASLPEVYATAWLNLFMEARLAPGEKVIIHAGASGVGTAAIQLCREFGNPCFVTAGSDQKIDTCIELGAEGGANRRSESFGEKAKHFAADTGIGVILDPVGGAYLEDNLHLLGMNGRLVLIGLMGGAKTEIDLAQLMLKRLRVIGSTLRSRPVGEKAGIMAELETRVWPLIESGAIRPIIDTTFSIMEAEAAHDHVASDQTIGKVVLTIPS